MIMRKRETFSVAADDELMPLSHQLGAQRQKKNPCRSLVHTAKIPVR
jgi:hypothetical protein